MRHAPATRSDFDPRPLIARYDRQVPRYTSYPTAPHFSDAVTGETYGAWLGGLEPATRLSLYLHVPFCHELCLYCGCNTTVSRRYGPVADYVEVLLAEIDLVAERLGGSRAVSSIHFGGGTPTILSPTDFTRVMERLRGHFDLAPDAEIAVEIDPRTLAPAMIAALAAQGVNRASLGVQDFDPEVQTAIARVQSVETTADVARRLRAAGIKALNFDLMYGLPHQTMAGARQTAATAAALAPSRLSVFGYAHVPWMKRHQSLIAEGALPDAHQRYDQMAAITEVLTASGYVPVGLDHFARADDPLVAARDAGRLRRNFQGYTTDQADALIGFGASAIGAPGAGYVQNATSVAPYRAAIREGRLATARGRALTAEDRLRGAIIERLMCDLEVDIDAIAAGQNVRADLFAPELARIEALAQDGIAHRDGPRVRVPDAARLFMRNVAAVFDAYLAPEGGRHARAI